MSPLYAPPGISAVVGPSGTWHKSQIVGTTAAIAVVSGQITLMPYDNPGPRPLVFSALGVNVGTAQSGGTTTTTLGYYRSGSTGAPDLVGGPVASGTVVLTTTGNRTASMTVTVAPWTRIWLFGLYVASVAPTTAPTVASVNSVGSNMWQATATAIGTVSRALFASSLTTPPTTAITLAGLGNSTAWDIELQV